MTSQQAATTAVAEEVVPEAGPSPVPVGVSRSRTFLPELESLRGIAVLLVLLMHANGHLHPAMVPWSFDVGPLAAFVRDGRTGVTIFFVLSGFLISLPFVQEARGRRRVVVREYLIRRALRILPLYATVVVVATVVTCRSAGDLVRGLLFLGFANSVVYVDPIPPWSAVWWSLGTEVQFYLVLPLVAALYRRARPAVGLLLLGYLGAHLAYQLELVGLPSIRAHIVLQSSLLGRAPLFLGGMLAAVVYDRHGERVRSALGSLPVLRNGGADAVLLGILAAQAYFLRWFVGLGGKSNVPPYQFRDFVDAAVWATVLLLLLLAPLRSKRVFSNAALARVGVLSYSIYLLHNPVLYYGFTTVRTAWMPGLFYWTPLGTAAVAVLGLACIGLAEVTYRSIEEPFLRRKARYDARAPV